MAGLFAVNGHVQINDAVLPLGESRHLHRRAVGDLLVQTQQHLLPHRLGADLAVRLVGGHAVGEELRPLLSVACQQPHQLLQPVAGACGDGHDGSEIRISLAVGGNDRQQVVLFGHGVDLIDAENARQLLLPDALQQYFLRLAHVGDRLHQQHRALHVRQALPHDFHHVVPQSGAGLVQTRCVQQHILGVPPVHHAVNAVSRGLGLIGHNGDLLPHQGVGQAGLAHIGPSAHGDHSGFCNVTHR